jgi:succinyl-diaminopimelate desuccinylase
MKTLLGQLVAAAPTAENGELRAAEVLREYFGRHGLAAEIDVWDGNRANAVVHVKAGAEARRPVLLAAAHLDVVPASAERWVTRPFEMVERDGRLYGRGTTDMLGSVAALAAALAETAQERGRLAGDVVFAATAGEETDSCGTKRFVQQFKERFGATANVLIPEPTDLKVLRAHRGILWLKIAAHGRTAHGSMPHLGINAILKINAVLNRLRDFTIPQPPHPLLGGCSMSVNRIAGGSGTNIVPEYCAVEIDIRTLPGQSAEAIVERFDALLAEMANEDAEFKAEVSVLRIAGAIETAENDPFVRAVCEAVGATETGAVGFTTDGPYFAPLGPVVIYGPGKPELCHKPDEWIESDTLERGKAMFKRIFLGC